LKAREKDWEELNPHSKQIEVMVFPGSVSSSEAFANRRSRIYVPMGFPTTAENSRWK